MKASVRTLADLGDALVLAPERHLAVAGARSGVPLGDLVVERNERRAARDLASAKRDRTIVLDTTHAKDGVLDVRGALRDGAAANARSTKKIARPGDLVVSRLRPYLRQIALVHPRAIGSRTLALSTEFYVLAPRAKGDLAFLLPFLLGADAQAALAGAQEGGHHPRVPRASLFALRVPHASVRDRAKTSRAVERALDAYYRAASRLADFTS